MDERKMDVLPIATRLFAEKGYYATSVEEIAKESGMAKGSFYKLFHSKEDLLFDILTIIPQQIKQELTKIYSKSYSTPEEALTSFISRSLENILSYQSHYVTSLFYEGAIFKNQELLGKMKKVHEEISMMLKKFFLHLYGDEIKDYIWDMSFLLKGSIMQYTVVLRQQLSKQEVERIAVLISTILDITAKGLLERKPVSVLNEKYPFDCFMGEDTPFMKGQRIHKLFQRLAQVVKDLELDVSEKEEYQKTLSLLEEECVKKEPKAFLLKALIHYLQSVPELKGACQELMELLELE